MASLLRPGQDEGVARNPLRDPRDKRLSRIAGPCGMVMFGVTGDLARKKLLPAVKVQQAARTGDRFAVANKDAEHGIRQNMKRFCGVMARAVFRRRNGKKCAAFS